MFKHREKTKEFFKKNIALLLAVVMFFGSFSSAGMAISSIFADTTLSAKEQALAAKGDQGYNFVNELVEITAEHVPYVWGGWQRDPYGSKGVDCRGFVRVGMRDTYGLSIFETVGYVCDVDGNPVLKNGKKQYVDVAAYAAESAWKQYVGQYICVEGNGIKTYYKVLCAGNISEDKTTVNSMKFADGYSDANVYDITHPTTGRKYSSLLAWACQYPGTIIAHNGHYGVGIGLYNTTDELFADYPGLDTWATSHANHSSCSKNGPEYYVNVKLKDESVRVARYDPDALAYGNQYSADNMKYYFGKTWYLNSAGTETGIRADNYTTMGKAEHDNELAILLCLGTTKTTEVTFNKYDAKDGSRVNGAVYGIYKNSSCTGTPLAKFTTSGTQGTKVYLSYGVYYVKEITAPSGYSLSNVVTKVNIDGTNDTLSFDLMDNPVNGTVSVQKVDASDGTYLNGAKFKIMEWNGTKYVDAINLEYNTTSRMYVIPSSYNNGELIYTKTNSGKFKLVETQAPSGYINDGYEKEFSIIDNQADFFKVENVANYQLKVTKYEAGTNTKLAGAEFSYTYTDARDGKEKTIYATTNSSGVAVFDIIPANVASTGILKETKAPSGYKIATAWANGQTIGLSKEGNISNNAFVTEVRVNNIKDDTTVQPTVTSGSITITKYGDYWYDYITKFESPKVNGAYYTIYTDSALTQVAVNKDGKKMENLVSGTDGAGTVVAENMAFGTYYIREVLAPNEYAVQPVTFVVNLYEDDAVNGVLNYQLVDEQVADLRQNVEINITKTDSVSGKPVEGAVYQLMIVEDNMSVESMDLWIPSGTILGYYKTDANGKITIDYLANGVQDELGRWWHASDFRYYLVTNGYGTEEEDERFLPALPNGTYVLKEVYAPNGYVLDSSEIVIDASWVNNSEEKTITVTDRTNASCKTTVGPSGMTMFIDLSTTNTRQTTSFEFEKTDSISSTGMINGYYGLFDEQDYQKAVDAGLVATLEGAAYQLTNTVDIKDINTGDIIPAGTVLGVYETETKNGKTGFSVTQMNFGTYAGHALPNGEYSLKEISAPQGYTLSTVTHNITNGLWDNAASINSNIEMSKVFETETVLMQQLEIHKVSADNEQLGLGGALFKVYSVASIITECDIDVADLPWDTTSEKINGYYQIDRQELLKLISDNNIQATFDYKYNDTNSAWENDSNSWVSDSDGLINTSYFLYGDYIIVEQTPPAGYEPSNAIYVQLPWVSTTDGEDSNEQVDGGHGSFSHDMESQPESAFVQTVTNKPEKINFTVLKNWDDNNDYFGLRPQSVTANLFADGEKVGTVVLNTENNWTYTWEGLPMYQSDNLTRVNYTVDEESTPEYYKKTVVGGTITNTCTYELPKTNVTITKTWDDENNRFGKRPESIQVQLYANGVAYETPVTLTAANAIDDNTWTYTWTDLYLKHMPQDNDIVYTVGEVSDIDDYSTTIVGYEIINSCTFVPKVDFTVNKVWDDDNNAAGARPDSVKVQLYVDGVASGAPVVLNEENNWTYTWSDMLQYNGLVEYVYTVDEIDVPDYYVKDVTGGTITNTYVPPVLIDYTVNKVWNDNNDKYEKRPSGITVQLFADGEAYGNPVTIFESTNWSATWNNLYKYRNKGLSDQEIVYSVREVNVPQYYEESVSGSTITNTCTYVPTTVFISKYEISNTMDHRVPVVGAKLQLVDENNQVAITYDGVKCEWTTVGTFDYVDEFGIPAHKITGLKPGTYKLIETAAPAGYITADEMTIVVEEKEDEQFFTMKNQKTKVVISKLDSISDMLIDGAKLAIIDENGNIVKDSFGTDITWISNSQAQIIYGLPFGTYYVRELSTPIGYQKSNDVKFEIIDDKEPVKVNVLNDRTLGTVEIEKIDADTQAKLSNVEIQLISVETVVDPITGLAIYEKNQVVATMITDKNGLAKTENLTVFTYNEHGYASAIKFKLIETKAPVGGQYDPDEISIEFTFDYIDDKTPVITKSFVVDNKKPHVVVTKTGTPGTFVGAYDERTNVTVVENGDEITYTITVSNNGAGKAWNVIVKDEIPANSEFVSVENIYHATYDATNNAVYWTIDELAPGNSAQLKFVVKAASDEACEIVNIAQYAMPDKKPTSDADKLNPLTNTNWSETDAVVHQMVTFEKTSTVVGGTEKSDATAVNVGDTIKYHLTFKSTNNVKNVAVVDIIPSGLTYVLGSATINGIVDGDANYNAATRELVFSTVDANGKYEFEFEVTVDDIPVDSVVYYENVANVTYSVDETNYNTLTSDVVTHRTEKKFIVTKTGTPATFEGEAANANNVTVLKKDDVIEYTLTATNNGASVIYNATIVDNIPSGLTYKSNVTPEGVKVWINNDVITWVIPELKVGESIDVKFSAVVSEQKANLIVNSAKYGTVNAVTNDAPVLDETAKSTNDVVHQVIEFHKTSNVAGGASLEDATVVSVGDTITYTLELVAKHKLTNVTFADPIPEGLKYVEGTMKVKAENDTEWTSIEDIASDTDGAEFDVAFDVEPGKFYVRFDTVVERIPVNTEKFYVNQATVEYDKFTGLENSERESLLSETVTHMTDVKVDGSKNGKIETFVGDYSEKNNVTVVKNGDEITYTITIKNTGLSSLKNVVIKDNVPEFTTFISADNNGQYDENTNSIVWVIDEIATEKDVSVSFIVKCNTNNEAHEIRNIAHYAVPVDVNDVQESEWIATDEVVHQTVAVSKDASIEHGETEKDAKYVKIGTTFTYIIKYNSTNTTYHLQIQDALPVGLKFVNGTAKYTLSCMDTVVVEQIGIGENGEIVFPLINEVPAGESVFMFDVTVEDVAEFDKDYFFINKATAIITENKTSENGVVLETNTVSNSTKKTETIDTPQLGLETTSPVVLWSMISIISAGAAITLGIYGMNDRKKKR